MLIISYLSQKKVYKNLTTKFLFDIIRLMLYFIFTMAKTLEDKRNARDKEIKDLLRSKISQIASRYYANGYTYAQAGDIIKATINEMTF